MKRLLAIFLIGISYLLSACSDKEQGKHDQSIASYQKAIAINPDLALAHNNLGIAYGEQGKYDLAIKSYQKAIAIKPDYTKAHNNLGAAYVEQGKHDLAIASYQKAITISPDYTKAHYNLGVLSVFVPGEQKSATAQMPRPVLELTFFPTHAIMLRYFAHVKSNDIIYL